MTISQSISELKRQAQDAKKTKVIFTNIDNEDFTWNFEGKPITVKTGKTKSCSLVMAEHLASHLADKLIEKRKVYFVEGAKEKLLEEIISYAT